ncbi:hypothetical protein TWF696_006880 [Orbilia brochopaga]|uniref:Peptidase S8/S53 domain-containing protein n=1 Tax=Orbilia brochopaga TaxID=3140254 RepID=A0AAV9USN3_9PEZI
MYDETYPDDPNSLFANVYDPPGSRMRTNELVRWLSSQLTETIKKQPHTVIVTAAGSDKIHKKEFLAPARDQLVFPDVVVTIGDTDLKDRKKIDDEKRGMKIRAWAPGEGIFGACYNSVDEEAFLPFSGSSYATAQAAALLAWFIGEDYRRGVPAAIEKLYGLAYPRTAGGPPMIYNGMLKSDFARGKDH